MRNGLIHKPEREKNLSEANQINNKDVMFLHNIEKVSFTRIPERQNYLCLGKTKVTNPNSMESKAITDQLFSLVHIFTHSPSRYPFEESTER